MNIIIKAFDGEYSDRILQGAFRGMTFGTVIDIGDQNFPPNRINAGKHIRMNAKALRGGRYPGVDWLKITPLDEALIRDMRECEAVFMTMIGRYARKGDIPYEERKRQYLTHLRYWNHVLETEHFDLLLMNTLPHQCYDQVLYDLCKRKGVPTLSLERCFVMDAFFVNEDWRESGKIFHTAMQELDSAYPDPGVPVPLSETYEKYFAQFTGSTKDPWYMYQRDERLARISFLGKWAGIALRMLRVKPRAFFRSMLSPAFWQRKLGQHRTAQYYDRYVKVPDLQRPYVYVPLHYQPEATTCPMGGMFTDQDTLVQLLAASLPPDVAIYVKEHPAQEELCRSEEFYESLRRIPSVTFVPRSFNTFALSDHALAIATVTGTAGFEAIFHGKPVLMFGHRFYQYAPGVFRIRTAQDCRDAWKKIAAGRAAPTANELRRFLRAVQDTTAPYVSRQVMPGDTVPKEKKAEIMGAYLAERLQPLFAS